MVARRAVMNVCHNSVYLSTKQFLQINNSCTPFAFKAVHIPVLFKTEDQKYLTVRPHSDVMYGVRKREIPISLGFQMLPRSGNKDNWGWLNVGGS